MIRQSWYNPKTMKPLISTSEKAWVAFGVIKRDVKREEHLSKYLKLLTKQALKKKNNEQIDTAYSEKLNAFGQKLLKKYHTTPTAFYAEQLLKKKKDGTWTIDKSKYDEAMERIKR
jgi:hypothetical protein